MMQFKKSLVQSSISAMTLGALALVVALPLPGQAANNRLSNVVKANAGSVVEEYLDLTLNVDWDYDANVVQRGTGTGEVPARVLDRAYIEALVRQTARTLYVMTNGRHRIGKVYVFKNSKFGTDVDIRVLNVAGRANANVAGWKAEGGLTTNNYITNEGAEGALDPESPEQTGEVIAHELGHYVYGLLDEYVEAGSACKLPAEQLGSPCQDDLAKPTVMNDQSRSYRLSLPADYAGTPAFRTAHSRGYGNADGTQSSAWEMLIRDPSLDSEAAKTEHSGRRIRFDAFKNIDIPTLESMKTFTSEGDLSRFDAQKGALPQGSVFEGYDKYLQLIYEGASQPGAVSTARPRNVIVVDRSLPAESFAQLITAAKGLIDRAPENARFALVSSPPLGQPQFVDMNGAGKTALKQALDGLTRTDAEFDLAQAYETSKALVLQARPAEGQPAEDAGNTDTVSLYTLANSSVPEDLGDQARADKIAFNVMAFVSKEKSVSRPPAAKSLSQLAKDSGGTSNTARSANEAIKETDKALREAMGMTESLITAGLSEDVLKAGTSFDLPFTVGSEANDGTVEVRYYFSEADRERLSFSCAPTGAGAAGRVTVEPVEEGEEEGVALCRIEGARTVGPWVAKATVAAGQVDADLIETEVVSIATGSPVEIDAVVEGGNFEDNRSPNLMVSFAGRFPIVNASFTAVIFDANTGELVKEVALNATNDAGTGGDARANDGVYTLSLANQLNAGDYFVAIDAVTDATNSRFNPNQRFANGVAPTAQPVGEVLNRLFEGEFFFEQGAVGVGAASVPATPVASSGGGGCTTGGGSDAGLMALMALALARGVSTLRRRRKTN